MKREREDGVRMEESGLTSDQLVPDCVDETMKGSDRRPKTTSFPSDDCGFSPLFYVRLSCFYFHRVPSEDV